MIDNYNNGSDYSNHYQRFLKKLYTLTNDYNSANISTFSDSEVFKYIGSNNLEYLLDEFKLNYNVDKTGKVTSKKIISKDNT